MFHLIEVLPSPVTSQTTLHRGVTSLYETPSVGGVQYRFWPVYWPPTCTGTYGSGPIHVSK